MLALLNQLMVRFKGALAPLMREALLPCVLRVHGALGQDWDWAGAQSAGERAPRRKQPSGLGVLVLPCAARLSAR